MLAGGLVLGVGVAATLAAWTDNEYARGTVTAGVFQVEGSSTGPTTGYTDHATSATAMVLSFSTGATALAPGYTTYTSVWLRTKNPSVAGTTQMITPTFDAASTGLQSYLTYEVRLLPAATACNATNIGSGTSVVTAGTSLTATLAATPIALAANQSAVQQYCIGLTMPTSAGNGAQGLSAAPIWQFAAVSS